MPCAHRDPPAKEKEGDFTAHMNEPPETPEQLQQQVLELQATLYDCTRDKEELRSQVDALREDLDAALHDLKEARQELQEAHHKIAQLNPEVKRPRSPADPILVGCSVATLSEASTRECSTGDSDGVPEEYPVSEASTIPEEASTVDALSAADRRLAQLSSMSTSFSEDLCVNSPRFSVITNTAAQLQVGSRVWHLVRGAGAVVLIDHDHWWGKPYRVKFDCGDECSYSNDSVLKLKLITGGLRQSFHPITEPSEQLRCGVRVWHARSGCAHGEGTVVDIDLEDMYSKPYHVRFDDGSCHQYGDDSVRKLKIVQEMGSEQDESSRVERIPLSADPTIEEVFMHFDTDNSGFVDAGEFREMCRLLLKDATDEDIAGIFLKTDVDGSGQISLAEFRAAINAHNNSWTVRAFAGLFGGIRLSSKEDQRDDQKTDQAARSGHRSKLPLPSSPAIEDIFAHYDLDDSGTIDYPEFNSMCKVLKPGLLEPEVKRMFCELDEKCSGHVELEQFRKLFEGPYDWAPSLLSQYASLVNLVPESPPKSGSEIDYVFGMGSFGFSMMDATIRSVMPDSQAATLGVQIGSVVTCVNRETVAGSADLRIIEQIKLAQHEKGAVRITMILPS